MFHMLSIGRTVIEESEKYVVSTIGNLKICSFSTAYMPYDARSKNEVKILEHYETIEEAEEGHKKYSEMSLNDILSIEECCEKKIKMKRKDCPK